MERHFAQHGKMTVQPGKRDEVIQRLGESTEVLHRTPGCIFYLIGTTDEPDVIWISELWASREAKEALATSPETAKVMKELMPLVVSITDQTVMTVVGGFGVQ
jgi:quinol monooxygenase YgiN